MPATTKATRTAPDTTTNGTCQHCGRTAPAFELLIYMGACHRPKCVRASMRANM